MPSPLPSAERALRATPGPPLDLDPGADPLCGSSIRTLVERYGSPLLLVDAVRLRRQHARLAAALPGVALHFAVKSLPHPTVCAVLGEAGACFDLATSGEVSIMRRLGIAPERCIHTHPIKRDVDIRNALDYGVTRFVADNVEELRKLARWRGRIEVLLRVAFRGREALCDLSRKFGCEPAEVPALIEAARALGLDVLGLSFHAGSQAASPERHVQAIATCAELLGAAAAAGCPLRVLDIGGGFPSDYGSGGAAGGTVVPSLEAFCAPIRAALAALPADLQLLAEPGRILSAPAAVAVASVMGRAEREGRRWYYLDDGLYGSYSGLMFDRVRYPIEALVADGPRFPSVLAGPTCDSVDVIDEDIALPVLETGDLVVGRAMGAYTWASASEFNLFPRARVLVMDQGRRRTEGEA